MQDDVDSIPAPARGGRGSGGRVRSALRARTRARGRALAVWTAAGGGFAAYLLSLGALMDTFGSIGTGVLLLAWLTLFSLLYHATPRMRAGRPEPPDARPLAGARAERGLAPLASRVDLIVAPSAALRSTAAQGSLLSVLGASAGAMTAREAEMMDWGLAFGVAWAVARRQDPEAAEAVVTRRALQVTQAVFRAYRGHRVPALDGAGPATANGAGSANGRSAAAHPHPHRS